MNYIKKIEIQYFRSIYNVVIKDLSFINVITGKNDVGKSNVLKALNLFFNNCVVKEGDYCFAENYNYQRLQEVRKDTIKGKQFIQIKITFDRGDFSPRTLPRTFTVSKKWNRDDDYPQITDDIESRLKKEKRKCTSRSRASLTKFLRGMHYYYIPAIKDETIFYEMLVRLQDTIYTKKLSNNQVLKKSLVDLYKNVTAATEELSTEFLKATSIESEISTPQHLDDLYKTLSIITKLAEESIPLESRGDGIRVRYLPSILNYIAINSGDRCVWGFEEPENSLEFNLARAMAIDFYEKYSKRSQIILTTHSPAFIALGDRDGARGYRCYRDSLATEIVDFKNAEHLAPLEEELGYALLWQRLYKEYEKKIAENQQMEAIVCDLNQKLMKAQRPIVLTEGKTDAQILTVAWQKLYGEEVCPFDIKSCNLMEEGHSDSLAGAEILKSILCSRRSDSIRVIIGVFDNDKAGKKAFGLDNNYKDQSPWKVHKNGKGYAVILPSSTEELKKISNVENLSIEFMFPRDALKKEVNGKKLKFENLQDKRIVNGLTIETRTIPAMESEMWYMGKIVSSSKCDFAFDVVPALEVAFFENFKMLFDILGAIMQDIGRNE